MGPGAQRPRPGKIASNIRGRHLDWVVVRATTDMIKSSEASILIGKLKFGDYRCTVAEAPSAPVAGRREASGWRMTPSQRPEPPTPSRHDHQRGAPTPPPYRSPGLPNVVGGHIWAMYSNAHVLILGITTFAAHAQHQWRHLRHRFKSANGPALSIPVRRTRAGNRDPERPSGNICFRAFSVIVIPALLVENLHGGVG